MQDVSVGSVPYEPIGIWDMARLLSVIPPDLSDPYSSIENSLIGVEIFVPDEKHQYVFYPGRLGEKFERKTPGDLKFLTIPKPKSQ